MTASLTRERIIELVAEQKSRAARLQSPGGKTMMDVPTGLPSSPGPAQAFEALRGQIDARAGGGATDHVSDVARLTDLLSILSQGTVDDEISRLEAAVALPLPPALAGQLREQQAQRMAHLRAIEPDEIAAVLASLDVLEPAFPLMVPGVRLRHVAGERARIEAKGERIRADAAADVGACRLTRDRIVRVLGILTELAPAHKKVQQVIGDPGVYRFFGAAVDKAFGKTAMKDLAKRGEDPQAFLADVVWIRIIAALVGRDGSVAASLGQLRGLASPDVWQNPYASPAQAGKRAQAVASEMSGLEAIHSRIDRGSEEAVRDMLDEIRGAMRPWRIIPGRRR